MWPAIAAGVSVFTFFATLRMVKDFDRPTQFLVMAIWLRLVLSAFHEWTFTPMAAGLSINALASVAVAGIGLLLAGPRLLRLNMLVTAWLIVLIVTVSAVINGEFGGMINDLIKWAYFFALAMLSWRAFRIYGKDDVLKAVVVAMLTPVILQMLSVALGVSKATENDGSISYIGGYYHEAAFSVMLFGFLCTAALVRWRWPVVGPAIVAFGIVCVMLTNYRTTILGTLPVMFALSAAVALGGFARQLRPIVVLTILIAVPALLFGAREMLPDRFIDVLVVAQTGADLVKDPLRFTEAEQDLFSGRVYLWSLYINQWLGGQTHVHIIGFGPEVWDRRLPLYAHNTFVSYIHEFGIVGVTALCIFFLTNIIRGMLIADRHLALRSVSIQVGFVILNLSTMPLWQIEGNILYALVIGATWSSPPLTMKKRTSRQSFPASVAHG
ncbi:O-antigen ligase family protein [Pontivivens ytuae]|uniref:O-antigen ligase family protein n=1 Tax=Pontivivens ytuae TaxID=2789856 RepID=A0A7S9LVF2_9RHOB|nr:O-antigen ligase family protein [Pontivivens ytuae]QPH56056.1 O-antigen ligase family protein [Pontivivens ytuae]